MAYLLGLCLAVLLPTAIQTQSARRSPPPVQTPGTVVVGVLQLERDQRRGWEGALRTAAESAQKDGCQILSLPARFVPAGADPATALGPLARELGVAIMATGTGADGRDIAVLLGPDGCIVSCFYCH